MPLIPDQYNLLFENREFSEDAHYYLASKLKGEYFTGRFHARVKSWMEDPKKVDRSFSSYKSYAGKTKVDLKVNLRRFREIDWENVVLNRHSSRDFSGEAVTFQDLSNLLILSCGLKENGKWLKKPRSREDWPKRALPSGGGMHPLEFYVLALHVKGLQPGLYHYNVLEGCLIQLRTDPEIFKFDQFWLQKDLFQNPAAIFYVSAVFDRSRIKYGERALRYVLLEAGGIGAHMNLTANAMGLDFCYDGGGYEDRIEKLIGIDGNSEGLVTSFMVGHSRFQVNEGFVQKGRGDI